VGLREVKESPLFRAVCENYGDLNSAKWLFINLLHRLRPLAACLRRLMRLTANNWPWAPRLQQHPAILALMAHLVEGLSTPSQQCRPPLRRMIRSSTCVWREACPPASGVLNALTMPTLWSLHGHGDVSMTLHAKAPLAIEARIKL